MIGTPGIDPSLVQPLMDAIPQVGGEPEQETDEAEWES